LHHNHGDRPRAALFSSLARNGKRKKKNGTSASLADVRSESGEGEARGGRGESKMKNSSGAIGAAKAPPYLMSHRRIINVIRIMYPRNSPIGRGDRVRRGSGGRKGRRKKGRRGTAAAAAAAAAAGGEEVVEEEAEERRESGNRGGRDAYLCCGIYRGGTQPVGGREEEGRGDGKGRGTVRVQRERRRCPHDRSPRQGRTLSLLNPGAAIPGDAMPSPRILHPCFLALFRRTEDSSPTALRLIDAYRYRAMR